MFEIKSNAVAPATGRVLISEPLLQDFYFRRSAVLLVDHGNDGSFGVIINKPIKTNISEIMPDLGDFDAPLYIGGPVDPKSIFFIHSHGDIIEGSEHIGDNLFWGGRITSVVDNILAGNISPDTIRFFLGYSGWDANQLEEELKKNAWAVTVPKLNELIQMKPELVWSGLVKELGDEYHFWTHLPADPQFN
ncbi:MAG TPA: YqgE/AlgH family protein [Bacteroidales bacterium]|nr:YqgE/AlgH family protein [Bacteroidales bacterium]